MSLTVLPVYRVDQKNRLKRLRVADRGPGDRAKAAVLVRSLRAEPTLNFLCNALNSD